MTKVETTLKDTLTARAIGGAKIGSSIHDLAARYNHLVEDIDPRHLGLQKECRVWELEDLQVWSDEKGAINRIFFNANVRQPTCQNRTFVDDMACVRECLHNCDFETFLCTLGDVHLRINQSGTYAQLKSSRKDLEIFAVFLSSSRNEPKHLALLRLNYDGAEVTE